MLFLHFLVQISNGYVIQAVYDLGRASEKDSLEMCLEEFLTQKR